MTPRNKTPKVTLLWVTLFLEPNFVTGYYIHSFKSIHILIILLWILLYTQWMRAGLWKSVLDYKLKLLPSKYLHHTTKRSKTPPDVRCKSLSLFVFLLFFNSFSFQSPYSPPPPAKLSPKSVSFSSSPSLNHIICLPLLQSLSALHPLSDSLPCTASGLHALFSWLAAQTTCWFGLLICNKKLHLSPGYGVFMGRWLSFTRVSAVAFERAKMAVQLV